ncbi:pyridoxal phosphate-dependent decarboxylase family protein [Bacteroidota bacterium]
MNKIKSFYNPAYFGSQAKETAEMLTKYLESVLSNDGTYAALPDLDPNELEEKYSRILVERTGLNKLMQEVLKDSNHLHHPGYIGHQCTAANPLAAVSAMAGALLNNGSAVYEMGPANVAMERSVAKFFAKEFGYPENADGLFTSGGSLGNLTALLAARQRSAPYDIWEEGLRAEDHPVVLVSEGSHYSIARSIKIMGMGEKAVLSVPVDKEFKMRIDLLEDIYKEQISSGKRIMALVSAACSTATGGYDDLDAITDFCEKHNIWHHVDAAHGGPAILSEKYKQYLNGAHRADSIVMDFHKMMMTPGLNTLILFRNENDSYATFAQKASYLLNSNDDKDWYNFAKRTMECTKSMMGLNVFTQLAIGGKELFAENIDRLFDQARILAELCRSTSDIELAVEPEANIVCFRYTSSDPGNTDQINLKIREEILKRGDFYIVQTVLNGKQYLRVSVMNPFTEKNDFENLLNQVLQIGRSQ